MEIKKYVEEQLSQLQTNKKIDLARVEGFYDGAQVTLNNIIMQIALSEKEDAEKKKPKVAKQ